jgi:hypothetical protein
MYLLWVMLILAVPQLSGVHCPWKGLTHTLHTECSHVLYAASGFTEDSSEKQFQSYKEYVYYRKVETLHRPHPQLAARADSHPQVSTCPSSLL